jgi:hypothetical protein
MRAVPRLGELYPGICLTAEEKARKTVRLAAHSSQADTVQYKNKEEYNTQKKCSNTE